MAASLPTPFGYQQFTGDGSKTDFTFSFDYLLREHVKVYLDKAEVAEGSAANEFQWEDTKKIKMGTAPTASQKLTIIRLTPEDKQQVPWNDGSYLVAEDLNTSDKQWLYLLEEHYDYIIRIIWGEPPVPGPGLPDDLFGLWNRLARNKDSNKGTADEVAQTIDKTDQLKGDANSPQNGEDNYVLTLGAISERLDLIKGDGSSYPGTGNTGQLGKLRVNSSNKLFYWDQSLSTPAWVEIVGGEAGAAATIAVGTTTTLDAGKDATVANSGSSSAAVFDFGIPKGAKGEDGAKGDDGATGPAPGLQSPATAVSNVANKADGSVGDATVAVEQDATSKDLKFTFGIPVGEKGPKGDKGADGTGAGTVTGVLGGAGIASDGSTSTPKLSVDLDASAPGLEFSGSGDNQKLKVKVKSGGGITVDSDGLSASSSGGVPDVTTDGSFNRTQSGGTKSWTTAAPADAQKNVQSDWSQSTNTADDFIKNKPTIPAAQIQSDWTQANTSALDFIKNKPTIPGAQVQSDWTEASTSSAAFIKNKPTITSSPWTVDGTTIKPATATNDVETTAALKTKQVYGDAVTLTGATVTPDFKDGNCFILSGAITTVNAPVSGTLKVGQSGKFYFLSGATVAGWNTNYKWPGGTKALAPTGLTIVPFYVATSSIILMGASTEDIK
jgi:hypothetical protein